MKTPRAYEDHANRCRALAQQVLSSADRDILLKIADTWDWIARECKPLDADNDNVAGEPGEDGKAD